MKIRIPILYIVLCLVMVVATASAQGKKLRVTADTAKIYIEPHTESTVIGTVSRGTVLTLFDAGSQDTSWYYVSFYSEEKWATITGFVEAAKVELLGSPEETQPKPKPVPKTPQKTPPKSQAPPPKKVKSEPPPKKEVKSQETGAQEAEVKAEAEVKQEEDVVPSPPLPEAELEPVSGEVKVTGEKPAIRSQDSEKGRLMQVAKFGQVLEVTARKGNWFRVKYPRPDGIILVGFLHESQVEVLTLTAEAGEAPAVEIEEGVVPDIPKEADIPEKEVRKPAQDSKDEKAMPMPAVGSRTGYRPGPTRLVTFAAQAGYAFPGESSYGSDISFGGGVGFLVNRFVSVELGLVRYPSQAESSPQGLSAGRLTLMPVYFSVQGRYPLTNRITPYAQVGVAYNFLDFKLCSQCQAAWDDLGFVVAEDVDNSLGFQVGAGLDYGITPTIAVNADLRYHILSGQGTWSLSDQFSSVLQSGELSDLNLNALVFRVGVKLFLKIF